MDQKHDQSARMPEPAPDSPPTAPAPPTVRTGPHRPLTHEPTWPSWLGVISIVLGALGVLMHIGTIAFITVVDLGEFMPPGVEADAWRATEAAMRPMSLGLGVLGLAVSTMLLAAGILIVLRRRLGVVLGRVWAIARIVLGILVLVATIMQGATLAREYESRGATPPAGLEFETVFWGILGLLWAVAWPIAMLIVLNRRAAKGHIATWR